MIAESYIRTYAPRGLERRLDKQTTSDQFRKQFGPNFSNKIEQNILSIISCRPKVVNAMQRKNIERCLSKDRSSSLKKFMFNWVTKNYKLFTLMPKKITRTVIAGLAGAIQWS